MRNYGFYAWYFNYNILKLLTTTKPEPSMITHQLPIRLAIADDHELFRDGLKLMLNKYAKGLIEIVIEAENGEQLLNEVEKEKPDVVLTDIKMPIMDGMEASRTISKRFPDIGIIAFSTFDESYMVFDMLEVGAKGYLVKNTPRDEIIDAIQIVSQGSMYYCNSTSRSLIRLIAPSQHNHFKHTNQISFVPNEIAIIKLICQQLTTKEIADRLHLGIRTVEDYSKRIKEKIDAKNLVGIALFAVKNHIVKLSEI